MCKLTKVHLASNKIQILITIICCDQSQKVVNNTYFQANIPIAEILKKRESKQPIIIAEGPNKGAIDLYSICIDGECIPLAPNSSSIHEFSSLFKSHFVFNLSYDSSLTAFWGFFEIFIAKIKGSVTVTPQMRELATRLFNTKQ